MQNFEKIHDREPEKDEILDLQAFKHRKATEKGQREEEERTAKLQERLLQDRVELAEEEKVMDMLFDKYDVSYPDVGEGIDDLIAETKADLEIADEDGHIPINAKKMKESIPEMEKDRGIWEAHYPRWKELSSSVAEAELGLYRLMGEEGVRKFFALVDYDESSVDQAIHYWKEMDEIFDEQEAHWEMLRELEEEYKERRESDD